MGIFGESKREAWERLCYEEDYEFVKGSLFKVDKVIAKISHWEITLDTYVVSSSSYTRLCAPFSNTAGFTFKMFKRNVFSGIPLFFGAQNISIGDPGFDEGYILKSNDEDIAVRLFSDHEILTRVFNEPQIYIKTKDTDILYFHAHGILRDVERLKNLFALFGRILSLIP